MDVKVNVNANKKKKLSCNKVASSHLLVTVVNFLLCTPERLYCIGAVAHGREKKKRRAEARSVRVLRIFKRMFQKQARDWRDGKINVSLVSEIYIVRKPHPPL